MPSRSPRACRVVPSGWVGCAFAADFRFVSRTHAGENARSPGSGMNSTTAVSLGWMLARSGAVSAILLLSVAAVVAAAPDGGARPPSSLQPTEPKGLIELKHRALRVRGCRKVSDWCAEDFARQWRVPSVRLHLVPIPQQDLRHTDNRKPIDWTIPAGQSPHSLVLHLDPGSWEVRTSRAHPRRIRVAEGTPTPLELWTIIGACVSQDARCVFRPDTTRHYIRPR